MSLSSDNKHQNDVEQLLTLAGPRDVVPAERLERMREAVHDAWTSDTTRTAHGNARGKRFFVWAIAAAAAAAIIFAIVRTSPNGGIVSPASPRVVARPVEIRTGSAERTSLRLSSGGELRVDASSIVTLTEGGEIQITKGALYLDSNGKALPAVLSPAGRITDMGTRFEVRLTSGNTRVRVRDGRIRLAQPNAVIDVGANEELLASANGSTARRRVERFGAEWAWLTRAAPRFELEGKSLGSFLDWIEKEGAWTVVFASPALERSARSTVLSGSIENMSTTQALETILPACGLTHRIDLKTGRLIVAAQINGS